MGNNVGNQSAASITTNSFVRSASSLVLNNNNNGSSKIGLHSVVGSHGIRGNQCMFFKVYLKFFKLNYLAKNSQYNDYQVYSSSNHHLVLKNGQHFSQFFLKIILSKLAF